MIVMFFVGCLYLRCFSLTVEDFRNLDSTIATRISLPNLVDAKYLIDERMNYLSKYDAKDSSTAIDKWRSVKAIVLSRIDYLKVEWPLLHFDLDSAGITTMDRQDLLNAKRVIEDQINNLNAMAPPDPEALTRWRSLQNMVLSRMNY
jgi:hypothetical protein